MAKAGRHTKYTPELAQEICEAIAGEYSSLHKICSERPHFPDPETILQWRIKYESFSVTYIAAKKRQAELGAEQLQKVSEKAYKFTYLDKDGNQKVDAGAIAAAKLESDNIRWATGRLAQALYGDKVENTHIIKSHADWLKELD